MGSSGLLATRAVLTVFAVKRKVAAWTRALLIDAAPHTVAHST